MTSFIAGSGSGRSISVIPTVPAAWSVTTIALMEIAPSVICPFCGHTTAMETRSTSSARGQCGPWRQLARIVGVVIRCGHVKDVFDPEANGTLPDVEVTG